jgi:FAD/FMN-containing dehydrogenase
MGWLARQFGLACDNVASYTVVTADGEILRATATDHPDLFWGLRGGGGNFGVVTEFEFRLHPISGQALVADMYFDPAEPTAVAALRAWRDLLPDAPREATLTSDTMTAGTPAFLPEGLHGRPVVTAGFVWIGEMAEARRYLEAFRRIGRPVAEEVAEMRYVDLQTIGDDRHHHGLRRYSAGHYLRELNDAAIDAYLARGVPAGAPEPDWSLMPGGGFQAYGGAIAEVGPDESAFSHRGTLVEFFAGTTWSDPAEDAVRMAGARTWAATLEPFSTGTYVNVLADSADQADRAYLPGQLARLADLKRRYDPDNVFHLNQNIRPAPAN